MKSTNRSTKKMHFSIHQFFERFKLKSSSFVNQKFTVMLIPHSERNVINFQVNNLILTFVLVLLTAIITGFFYMATVFSASDRLLDEQQDDLVITQGNLDSVLDEVGDLVRVYGSFENAMRAALDALDLSVGDGSTIVANGDLSSISDIHEVNRGEAREIYDVRRLSQSIEEAIQPLEDISSVLHSEKQLLTDLPTLWPISGGYSAVTMEFGPNIHPIEGRWYLHKGIDIAGPFGLPVLASANGRVIESAHDQSSGYGNYVLLEHKYGFKTRYSHLATRLVHVGQTISQGDRIGTLGSTGISSGAHLDFQIMLGTEVLDPSSFLSIKNTFTRWTGNR